MTPVSLQDYEAQVTKNILEVAEQEVEKNPQQLLSLDRRKATALLDGALERSGFYQKAEAVIGQLIDSSTIEESIRDIRRADIGEEAAEQERVNGAKTDEDYAAATQARRDERERIRSELRAKEEAIEAEKQRIVQEEQKREEREREKAELKRQEERDERRRKREKEREEREKERDRQREERHKEREQRDRERDQDRDRDRPRDRDRDRDQDRSRRHSRDRAFSRDRDRNRDRDRDRDDRPKPKEVSEEMKKKLSLEDNERLEKEALEDLLRECSGPEQQRQPEPEIDTMLAPPPRKSGPASAIDLSRKDSPRTESRRPRDTRSRSARRDSRTPRDSRLSDLRGDRRSSRSASRTLDRERTRERSRPRDADRRRRDDSRRRDDRSRSPRRDRSRSKVRDRRHR